MSSTMMAAQIRLNRVTTSHCRVVLDNPPLNLMGPGSVLQSREIVTELENDDRVKGGGLRERRRRLLSESLRLPSELRAAGSSDEVGLVDHAAGAGGRRR